MTDKPVSKVEEAVDFVPVPMAPGWPERHARFWLATPRKPASFEACLDGLETFFQRAKEARLRRKVEPDEVVPDHEDSGITANEQ